MCSVEAYIIPSASRRSVGAAPLSPTTMSPAGPRAASSEFAPREFAPPYIYYIVLTGTHENFVSSRRPAPSSGGPCNARARLHTTQTSFGGGGFHDPRPPAGASCWTEQGPLPPHSGTAQGKGVT